MRGLLKKTLFLLITFLASFSVISTKTYASNLDFELTNTELRKYDGTLNTVKEGNIDYKGVKSKIKYNILEYNQEENVHLVTVSSYNTGGWGASPLIGMIESFERKYPNIEVLGGINGDFYDINGTKAPTSNFIENYEVIKGTQPNRVSFNILSDDSFNISTSKRLGYEILIKNEHGEIIFRKMVDSVNKVMDSSNKIGVFISSYVGEIAESLNAVVIDNADVKIQGSFEFAKGNPNLELSVPTKIENSKFVVVGDELKEYLIPTNTVIVQNKLEGFENVRGSIGGSNTVLVKDGLVNEDLLTTNDAFVIYKHPRSAVGIKKDGSVFFFLNDGRDDKNNVPGLKIDELAILMKNNGAVHAMNLDGGGSSTLAARNLDGTFEILNFLSDGRERSISNGILIVRGDVPEQPVEIIGDDNRTPFIEPKNIYIDADNVLNFSYVNGASRYLIDINGVVHETSENHFDLNKLLPREYEIKVYTKGNNEYKTSISSSKIKYLAKERTTNELLKWLQNFAINNN